MLVIILEAGLPWNIYFSSPMSHVYKATTKNNMLYALYFQDVFSKYKHNLQQQTGFLTALLNSNPPVIAEAYPLHSPDACKELSTMWKASFIPISGLNLDKIRNYFGMSLISVWLQNVADRIEKCPCAYCTFVAYITQNFVMLKAI